MSWYVNSNEHTAFDKWLNEQIPMAFARMRQNIIESPRPFSLSGIGKGEFMAKTGAVMASPFHQSIKNAYAYHWTRDAAHTMGLITRIGRRNALPQAKLDTATYHQLMDNWVAFEKAIQRSKDGSDDKPKDPSFGNSYAEAKYFLDGTSYVSYPDRPWANPQFDGPALRAIAMIRYANELTDPTAACSLYSDAIFLDLKRTADTIGQPCIDAWEEVRGLHFNVLVTQIRALFDGIALAERLQQKGDTRWLKTASDYRDLLKSEFLDGKSFVRSTKYLTDYSVDHVDKYKVLHLDASVLGGIMLADGVNGFPPLTSDIFLTTARYLVEAFRDGKLPDVDGEFPNTKEIKIDAKNLHDGGFFVIRWTDNGKEMSVTLSRDPVDSKYPINQQRDGLLGYAIGRYPEDRYNGYYSNHRDKEGLSDKNDTRGNPWFICTTNLGEFYYRVADAWLSEGTGDGKQIELTLPAVEFLASLPRPVAVSAGKVTSPNELRKVVLALFDSGDAQLLRVQKHLHYGCGEKTGAFAEQFTRDGGLPVGAQDLTWSYAAFLEAAMTRSQVVDKLAAQSEPR